MLSIKSLTKVYASTGNGIKNISFELKSGEILVLLGPNGSGKSTILKCISGIVDYSGEIIFKGRDISEVNHLISYLPENSPLVEKFTAMENLLFFAWAYGVDEEVAKSKASELLKLFGLEEWTNSLIEGFSYGMRRRLALAQTLLPEPELLLLDEPSLGLDYSAKITLYRYLRGYTSPEKSIIVATNDVVEAQELAHRVGFVYNGRILEIEKPAKLLEELGEKVKIKIKFKKPPETLSYGNIMNGSVEVVHKSSVVLPEIIHEVIEKGGVIESIFIKEPDLGDVFLKKTGGKLR